MTSSILPRQILLGCRAVSASVNFEKDSPVPLQQTKYPCAFAMRRLCRGFLCAIAVTHCLPASGQDAVLTESETASEPGNPTETLNLADTVRRLGATSFETRLAADRQLSTIPAARIPELAQLAITVESAESASRILNTLQLLYLEADALRAKAAAEALEVLLNCDRVLLQEEATWVLTQYWQRRQEFTLQDLERHGLLIVRPETRRKVDVRNVSSDGLHVFITEEWDGSDRGRQLLDRLPGLARQLMAGQVPNQLQRGRFGAARIGNTPPSVVIFLVRGHSLTKDGSAQLKGAYGASVQDRAEVMMGIQSAAGIAGKGCRIRQVIAFGSADAAGIQPGNTITSLADTPIESFEDLVEELKQYHAGDIVSVRVRRGGFTIPPGQGDEEDVMVKLLSWGDYVRAINAAAAEIGGSPAVDRVQ